MTVRSALKFSNRRVRILVGLLLAGLFAIQCSKSDAFKQTDFREVLNGEEYGNTSDQVVRKLNRLAKTDHTALLEFCLASTNYSDYSGVLIKQERLRGRLGKEQWVDFKFREIPFSVSMHWTKNAGLGDRVLFAEGQWDGKMVVRPTSGLFRSLLGSVKKDPRGDEARGNSLRTVDQFGFRHSAESLLEFYREGKARGVMREEFGGYAKVADRDCLVLIRYLPDGPEWPSYKTLTFLDIHWRVPICVEGYDAADELVCKYVYKDVKFNVGLTDLDFTPKANGMADPK